jgi:hypothetical protein
VTMGLTGGRRREQFSDRPYSISQRILKSTP